MQHDRFAREIAAILAQSDAARSRRLMRNPLGRLSDRCWLMHQKAGSSRSSIRARDCDAACRARVHPGATIWPEGSAYARWQPADTMEANPYAQRQPPDTVEANEYAPSQPANSVEGSAYAPSQPADIVEANPYAQWRRANTVEAREYARWHAPDVRKRKAGPYHTEPAQPAAQADAAARPANARHFVTRSRHQRGLDVA